MTTMNRVHAVTARQHGVIAYAQLLELGWSRAAVRHLVRSGRLRRVHRSVYAPAGLCLAPAGRARAAVMACGDGAALSHFSAAALWDLRDHWPLLPQVTVPNATGSTGPKGIELHHSLTLGVPESVTAIPVTTIARTLDDIAPRLQVPSLKAAVRQAERLHNLDLTELRPRATALRHVLDRYVTGSGLTQDELEPLFLELCAGYGIPLPETQVTFGAYRADFVWRDVRLIVETDGRQSHDGFVAYREDRVRDRALKRSGYEVLHFTYAEVVDETAAVAAEVIEARRCLRSRGPTAPRRW